MNDNKMHSCRYYRPHIENCSMQHLCVKDGYGDDHKIIDENICKNCDNFKSRYITYPVEINGIENEPIKSNDKKIGTFVKVRPCANEYGNKTYLGIYLGRLPINILSSLNNETKVLTNSAMLNPAIFVPDLKKIIYGIESFWSEIESPDDITDITDETIENQFYIKALKSMFADNTDRKET